MLRGFRIAVLIAVFAAAGGVLGSRVGADPSATAAPGREEAEKLLDCPSGDQVFSYNSVWAEGSGSDFSTPREALDALLVGADFLRVEASEFVGKDVEIGAGADAVVGVEFTKSTAGGDDMVTWVVPADGGWLADGLYGCFTDPDATEGTE